jgi:hypothetical protein
MKTLTRIGTALMLLTSIATGFASTLKDDTKKAGRAIGETAHEVAQGTKEAAVTVGKATKKTAKKVGHTAKEVAVETGHAFRDGARELKKAAKGDAPKDHKPAEKSK